MSVISIAEAVAFARDALASAAVTTGECSVPAATGPPIQVLQPHSDDAALSIGGLLRLLRRMPRVLTAFSESSTAATRSAEDEAFVERLGGTATQLGLEESTRRQAVIQDASRELRDAVLSHVDSSSPPLAPAGVGEHPDHVAVATLARDLGTEIYWADVAFWGIYGSSVEDRLAFSNRSAEFLKRHMLVGVEITSVADQKVRDLEVYASQSSALWRPLRYAAAVAAEHGLPGYCERLFVTAAGVESLTRMLPTMTLTSPHDMIYGGVVARACELVTRSC